MLRREDGRCKGKLRRTVVATPCFLLCLQRLISFRFGLREAFVPLFDIDIHVEVERLWNVVAGSGENDFRRVESGLPARIGVAAECEQSGHRVSLFSTVFPVEAGLPPSRTRIDSRFPQAVRTPGPRGGRVHFETESTSRPIRRDGLWPDEKRMEWGPDEKWMQCPDGRERRSAETRRKKGPVRRPAPTGSCC